MDQILRSPSPFCFFYFWTIHPSFLYNKSPTLSKSVHSNNTIYLSINSSTHHSIYSFHLSIYPSFNLFHSFIHPSIIQFILFIYPSIHPSILQFILQLYLFIHSCINSSSQLIYSYISCIHISIHSFIHPSPFLHLRTQHCFNNPFIQTFIYPRTPTCFPSR